MSIVPPTTPLISVRIPTKNRSQLLRERALASVFYQTYPNLEIVVVGDDCSVPNWEAIQLSLNNSPFPAEAINLPPRTTDDSKLIEDPQIRWFIGPVRATNVATYMCRGEWIAHLDDDDIWTPDHVERSLNYALENNYDFVSSKIIRKKNGKFEEVRGEDGIGGCQTWLYRAEIAKRFPYDEQCYKKSNNKVSDLDVAERLKMAGVRMGFLDEVGAYVLPRPGEDTIGLEAYKKYGY